MSTPTDSSRDELATLRERAYGLNADIHDDPAALARLSELEEQAAAASAANIAAHSAWTHLSTDGALPRRSAVDDEEGTEPVPLTLPPPERADAAAAADPTAPDRDGRESPAPTPPGAGSTDADAGGTDPADSGSGAGDEVVDSDAEDAAVATARPWWRRLPVLWAASVVAAVLAGVALTLLVQSMEAGRVGVLHIDPDAEWPEDVWAGETEDSFAFETFYGLTVLSQPQVTGDGTQGPVPCLIVFSGVGDNPSYLGGSCGAGSFPAEAVFIVGRQAPSELRDRFPVGTAMQFVLDGEQVHVYAREPSVVEP
ncbi:hypothetical protein JNB63_16280 [Microbacterium trichothecenolyticum]|uniref:hypothetical protein n=1 Tax=Microbacterium trichothecenolyticum TaxID=69370 RepID=UPI001C6F36CB|nr:hypothetical protein [Microbacterium trichothecenolyticum]MBW9121657.1 hypothetical protein [Microbacterium trichothecenolyticum]